MLWMVLLKLFRDSSFCIPLLNPFACQRLVKETGLKEGPAGVCPPHLLAEQQFQVLEKLLSSFPEHLKPPCDLHVFGLAYFGRVGATTVFKA